LYFRSGYAPEQYPSEAEWKARLTLERSRAIKCPSIHYHLAGTKKVQQQLAAPGVLERFVDRKVADRIRAVFTGLYPLDEVRLQFFDIQRRQGQGLFQHVWVSLKF
jgi:hypothetical protein